jgi:hypothetical protein
MANYNLPTGEMLWKQDCSPNFQMTTRAKKMPLAKASNFIRALRSANGI